MTEHLHGKISPGHGRLLGLERHYRCGSCGEEHVSWRRVHKCPGCGAPLTAAVIRRAAVAPAG